MGQKYRLELDGYLSILEYSNQGCPRIITIKGRYILLEAFDILVGVSVGVEVLSSVWDAVGVIVNVLVGVGV
jgi:hypothetical protein